METNIWILLHHLLLSFVWKESTFCSKTRYSRYWYAILSIWFSKILAITHWLMRTRKKQEMSERTLCLSIIKGEERKRNTTKQLESTAIWKKNVNASKRPVRTIGKTNWWKNFSWLEAEIGIVGNLLLKYV